MEQDRRSGWYDTSPHREWYRQYSTKQEAAALKVPDLREVKKPGKKRTGVKVTMISLCVLILIAATALAFAEPPSTGTVGRGIQPDPYAPDVNDDFPENFRDFFRSYYSASSNDEVSRLPRAKTADGVSMTLTSSDGLEKLTLGQLYDQCVDSTVGVAAMVDGQSGYFWGTGIIMTEDGYILTNAHIIADTDYAYVTTSDGKQYEALLVGEDSRSDIAVLKIKAGRLRAASFGRSDELTVGDEVAAIGNPLGNQFSGTMTNGIISAIERDVMVDSHMMTLIQTNTALNEGNSGGPLLNMYGQVVGITNMKMVANFSRTTIEGIGFAIPTSVVQEIVNELIENGQVSGRPGIGISVSTIPFEHPDRESMPDGLYIVKVETVSDAYAKDVRAGDVLTAVNGSPVRDTQEVGLIRDKFAVGDTITLTIYREGETFDVEIELMDINELY